jgi:hypothetical protein
MESLSEAAPLLEPEPQRQYPEVRPTAAPAPTEEINLEPLKHPVVSGSWVKNWPDTLWREWCNAEDGEYAHHLFDLLKATSLDWTARTLLALGGTLYGILFGYLLGLMGLNWEGWFTAWRLNGSIPALSAWLGGIAGGIGALLLGQRLSWQGWLSLLIPNAFAKRTGRFGLMNLGLVLGLLAGGVLELNTLFLVFPGIPLIFIIIRLITSLKDESGGSLIGFGLLGFLLGNLLAYGNWFGLIIALGVGGWLGFSWGSSFLWLLLTWLGLLGTWLMGGSGSWLVTWLGLGAGFGLGSWLNLARARVDAAAAYAYRPWYFWWRRLPPLEQVKTALHQAQAGSPDPAVQGRWTRALVELDLPKPGTEDLDSLLRQLFGRQNWVERFAARQALLRLGHKAVEPLRVFATDPASPFQDRAIWLLAGIEAESTRNFARRLKRILCPDCLTRFGPHSIKTVWGLNFKRYGCRTCGQDQAVLDDVARIIAVLDAGWAGTQRQRRDILYVNWLQRHSLFDFGAVEIIDATDQEVERFAVQVGNDTDPLRRRRYPRMTCLIRSDCHLSENSLKILRRIFGRIERWEVKHGQRA